MAMARVKSAPLHKYGGDIRCNRMHLIRDPGPTTFGWISYAGFIEPRVATQQAAVKTGFPAASETGMRIPPAAVRMRRADVSARSTIPGTL